MLPTEVVFCTATFFILAFRLLTCNFLSNLSKMSRHDGTLLLLGKTEKEQQQLQRLYLTDHLLETSDCDRRT